jgi:hypothetical protein
VTDRHQRGPYRSVEDLVVRGVVTPRQMGRVAPRLVCITPADF